MNIQELMIPFTLFTAVVGGLVKLLLLQHQKRMDERFEELTRKRDDQDERIDDHESRISKLEGSMSRLPSHGDMDDIKTQVSTLARETSEQTGMLNALTKKVGLIQQWLYEKAK